MNTFYQAILIIMVVAISTFFTRLLPFLFFRDTKKIPPIIQYLGKYLPPSVIAILVVYCLKGVSFQTFGSFVPTFLAVLMVILLHLWKRNNLISIGGGTLFYMIILQLF